MLQFHNLVVFPTDIVSKLDTDGFYALTIGASNQAQFTKMSEEGLYFCGSDGNINENVRQAHIMIEKSISVMNYLGHSETQHLKKKTLQCKTFDLLYLSDVQLLALCKLAAIEECFRPEIDTSNNNDCSNALLSKIKEIFHDNKRAKRWTLNLGGTDVDMRNVVAALEVDRKNIKILNENAVSLRNNVAGLITDTVKNVDGMVESINGLYARSAITQFLNSQHYANLALRDMVSDSLSTVSHITSEFVSIAKELGVSNARGTFCNHHSDTLTCSHQLNNFKLDGKGQLVLEFVGESYEQGQAMRISCIPGPAGTNLLNNKMITRTTSDHKYYLMNDGEIISVDETPRFDPDNNEIFEKNPCYYNTAGDSIIMSCKMDVSLNLDNQVSRLGKYVMKIIPKASFPLYVNHHVLQLSDIVTEVKRKRAQIIGLNPTITGSVSDNYLESVLAAKIKQDATFSAHFIDLLYNNYSLRVGVISTVSLGFLLVVGLSLLLLVCALRARNRGRVIKRDRNPSIYPRAENYSKVSQDDSNKARKKFFS